MKKDEDLWAGFEAALRAVFGRNGRDPTLNFEVQPDRMSVRIRSFRDSKEWLRYAVSTEQLQDPLRTATAIYTQAERNSDSKNGE